MRLLGVLGLAVGAFVLFCLGKKGAPTQPGEIASPDPASAFPDSNQPKAPAPPLVVGLAPKSTNLPVARVPVPLGTAQGSIYRSAVNSVVFQTRRMQGFS